jgi:IS6 family transposase
MPRRCRPVPEVPRSAFKGFRFPPEIVVLAVRWYLRFGLSYRDVEELLTERGIEVDQYVKVAGQWRYVYRAVDQHGQVIDVFVSLRRDTQSARRFFETALGAHGEPVEVVTDRAPAMRAVIEELMGAFDGNHALFAGVISSMKALLR